MEVTGTIYKVNETQVVSEKFRKKEIILKTVGDQYSEHLNIQLSNDKCELITDADVGATVTLSLNIKGHLWKNKQDVEVAFNTLECWKVVKKSNF